VNNPIIQGFVYNILILTIRMFIVAVLTGIFKTKEGASQNPEDRKKTMSSDYTQTLVNEQQKPPVSDENSLYARMGRIHRNDVENILPFFLMCATYIIVSSQGSDIPLWNSIIGNVLMFSFTLSRILYFFAYWRGWQPWRTLIWMWGVLTTLLIGVYTVVCLYVL